MEIHVHATEIEQLYLGVCIIIAMDLPITFACYCLATKFCIYREIIGHGMGAYVVDHSRVYSLTTTEGVEGVMGKQISYMAI